MRAIAHGEGGGDREGIHPALVALDHLFQFRDTQGFLFLAIVVVAAGDDFHRHARKGRGDALQHKALAKLHYPDTN